jgi:glycosyltransferase involved in cell wall biosynthesis
MSQPDSSSRRKRLVIADAEQFGYLTDTYQYCNHLRHEFDVTYVGWDYGRDPIRLSGIRVVNVSRDGGKLVRVLRLMRTHLRVIKEAPTDIVLVEYNVLCTIIRLLSRARHWVLDIRTGHVKGGPATRYLLNLLLRFETAFFPHIIILSESLREMLRLDARKCRLVPLGAEVPELPDKDFTSMRLFYVGVFDGRHIERTVEGLDLFYRKFKDKVDVRYDIVGYCFGKDTMQKLDGAIQAASCRDRIAYHGRVPYPRLRPFLESNNIGVAFVPRYSHYEVQPATKLFEYALSGMAVIATSTLENARVMSPEVGVLIDDTAEGFYDGLQRMLGMLSAYNSRAIKQTFAQHSWENIVRGNLAIYLHDILRMDSIAQPGRHNFATQRIHE